MGETEWAPWLGREQTREDWITPSRVAAWEATFDRDCALPADGEVVPAGFHWTLCPAIARESELGADGHPRLGGFLPPVPLPSRMWAGSRVVFHQPLGVGDRVERRSIIAAIEEKQRRNGGRLVFVTVRHLISGGRGVAIEEEQDLVYREASPPRAESSARPGGAGVPGAGPVPGSVMETRPLGPDQTWQTIVHPSETLLFRFSALTFNGHRIHYDRRYAEDAEGYAGLVVHGPLIATLLLDSLPRQRPGATVERFHFKALHPMFDGSPFAVRGAPTEDPRRFRLWATNDRGETAMEAEAWIR